MTDRQAKRVSLRIIRRPPNWEIKAVDAVLDNTGCKTQRQWRALKRKQLRELEKAACKFLLGSAYTPTAYDERNPYCIGNILDAIRALRRSCSVKNWGR